MHNNHATYRAKSFLVESNESSMVYEVKRTRATWDPSLAIPGTDRRGGWRCPVGTRYGGQITDRFGRNCGWGVARRLSNTISNIGERLENVDDRRRGRRIARRNERMVRQLREGGRIERAARRVADVLETEDTRSSDRNIIEPPRAPRAPRRQRGALRMSEERRMQREIDEPGAPRTGEVAPEPRPIAPRVRRQTANRNRGVNRPVPQPAPEPEMIQPPKKAAAKKAAAKKVPAKKVAAKKRVAKKVPAKKAAAKKATAPRVATPRPATPPAREATPEAPEDQIIELRDIPGRERIGDFGQGYSVGYTIDQNADLDAMQERVAREQEAINDALRFLQALPENQGVNIAQNEDEAQVVPAYRARQNLILRSNSLDLVLINIRRERQRRAQQAPQPNAPEVNDQLNEGDRARFGVNRLQVVEKLRNGQRIGRDNEQALGFDQGAIESAREDGRLAARNFLDRTVISIRGGAFNNENDINEHLRQMIKFREQQAKNNFEAADNIAARIQEFVQAEQNDGKSRQQILDREYYKDLERQFKLAIRAGVNQREAAEVLKNPATRSALLMELPPRPVEDLAPAEVIRAAQQRIDKAINDRQDILGEYLNGRYGEGQAPWLEMTQDRFAELARKSDDGDTDARLELKRWAEAMYSHELIRGSNGKNYAIVAEARIGNGISISANIYYVDPDGNRQLIGDSSRTISLRGEQVSNNHMKIRVATHKNAGIQTIYNQHAFMYAKAAGFKRFSVSAVDDGPYVWGRVGFRQPVWGEHIVNMRNELNQFRNGRQSLIKSEDDANIIDFLLAKYDRAVRSGRPQEQPRHMDFIYAISNNERRGSQAYKTREADLKRWFLLRMPFSSGMFDLEENKISADPRRRAQ